MISFDEVMLEKVIPHFLQEKEEIKALSYALKTQMDKLMKQIGQLNYWADLDNASEMILDALGFELNIPGWNLKLSREQKIELVKNAIKQKYKLGTPQMLESFLNTILGEKTQIKEWFETGGVPGTFKIITTKSGVGADDIETTKFITRKISRISQHISAVDINLKSYCDLKIAGIVRTGTYETLFCKKEK